MIFIGKRRELSRRLAQVPSRLASISRVRGGGRDRFVRKAVINGGERFEGNFAEDAAPRPVMFRPSWHIRGRCDTALIWRPIAG